MSSRLYMAVTNDDLELPVAVEESMTKLGKTLGVSQGNISKMLSGKRKGIRTELKFVAVNIEEVEFL